LHEALAAHGIERRLRRRGNANQREGHQ
jgi:hypothetical protein